VAFIDIENRDLGNLTARVMSLIIMLWEVLTHVQGLGPMGKAMRKALMTTGSGEGSPPPAGSCCSPP